MSLVPRHTSKNYLSVQFNQNVSDKAYANARDEVLLTRGVKLVSEEAQDRTMRVEAANDLIGKLEQIPGVESVETERQSHFGGKHHL